MSDPVRLSKRVADLAGCSRTEAEQYIKGGWVSVDGRVVEDPAHPVSIEVVTVDPAPRLERVAPATILLHKPVGFDAISGRKAATQLVQPGTRRLEDPPGGPLLQRPFKPLRPLRQPTVPAPRPSALTQQHPGC